MPKKHSHTATKSKVVIALGVVILAILLAGIYHVRDTKAFVDATTHQPERYTELYFTDSNNLPINAVHGKSLTLAFTIHNLEARTMTYTYNVSFLSASATILSQKQGTITESVNGSKSITSDISVPTNYAGKAEVQVTLTNLHNQAIHFWVLTR